MQVDIRLKDEAQLQRTPQIAQFIGHCRLQVRDDIVIGDNAQFRLLCLPMRRFYRPEQLNPDGFNGQHGAVPIAIRARFHQQGGEAGPRALACHLHKPQIREVEDVGARPVLPQRVLQHFEDTLPVRSLFHIDEIDDDDAPQIAQLQLTHDFFDCLHVGTQNRVVRVGFSNEPTGVDINGYHRLGLLNDNVSATFEPDFLAECILEFALHIEFVKKRGLLLIQYHPLLQIWHHG